MIDGVNIQLSGNEAEFFFNNLMHPSEATAEARRHYLQEIENDIVVQQVNGGYTVYSESIDTDSLIVALRNRNRVQKVISADIHLPSNGSQKSIFTAERSAYLAA